MLKALFAAACLSLFGALPVCAAGWPPVNMPLDQAREQAQVAKKDLGNLTLPDAFNNLYYTPPFCDGFLASDGAMAIGSDIFTSASAQFQTGGTTAAYVGETITINGAGGTAVYQKSTVETAGTGWAPGDTINLAGTTVLKVRGTKVVSATVAAGGNGGSDGSRTATGTTGVGTRFQAIVTVSGGAITSVDSIATEGIYRVNPTDIANEPVTGFGIPVGAKLSLEMGLNGAYATNLGSFAAGTTPANPVTPISTSGSGTGTTFNVTWVNTNLVTTIASIDSDTQIHLANANASGANVTNAVWGYSSDYASAINTAKQRGANLPPGVCGIASALTLASKDSIVGQGPGPSNPAAARTTLLWIGPVGGTMISATDIAGIQLKDAVISGGCAAATGINFQGVQLSRLRRVFVRDVTQTELYMDATASNNTQFNEIGVHGIETTACGHETKQFVIGPGQPTRNTDHNKFYDLRALGWNGAGFECGNADSNDIYSYIGQQVSGISLDLLDDCRSNKFFDAEPQNWTDARPGSEKNYLQLNTESGAPYPAINPSATLECVTNTGFDCGNVGAKSRVICSGGFQSAHTGDTNETLLAPLCKIPRLSPGINGRIVIDATFAWPNNPNNKTPRIRFGASGTGLSGSEIFSATETTSVGYRVVGLEIRNQSAFNAQHISTNTVGSQATTVDQAGIDTHSDTELNFTGQLGNAADTISVISYEVRVSYAP